MENNIYGNNSIIKQDRANRIIAMISHLISLFSAPLGALVIWLIMRNENSFVEEHSRNSFNWQISLVIYSIISGFLCLILVGYLMLALLAIWNVIAIILASIAAYDGKPYKYPFTINLLK